MPRLPHTAVAHGLFTIHQSACPVTVVPLGVPHLRSRQRLRRRADRGARAGGRRLGRRVEKKKAQMAKAELTARAKEELKMVALGTSKINYLDPRITIAWCKAREVPLEKARAPLVHSHATQAESAEHPGAWHPAQRIASRATSALRHQRGTWRPSG